MNKNATLEQLIEKVTKLEGCIALLLRKVAALEKKTTSMRIAAHGAALQASYQKRGS